MEMSNFEWTLVVSGWIVIILVILITRFKYFRISSAYFTSGNSRLVKEVWGYRAIFSIYAFFTAYAAYDFDLIKFENISNAANIIYVIIGSVLFILSIILFISARLALGRIWKWGGEIKVVGKNFIANGPYKIVRHPQYTSYIIAGIASGLILTEVRIIVFVVAILPLTIWKAYIEERFLLEYFGKEYEKYRKNTKMFL